LAPERFALHTTIDRECRDLLEEAKVLMSHAVSPGDIPEILKRGLKRLVRELRCRKLGDVSRSRPARPLAAGSRTIPAHVRRAVWRREGGQCSFVSASGHRCEARALLEFHHEIAFAQGGEATVGTISLRCRAHNYYEAEQVFGAGFMARKSRTR
jgi:hypothetical protein